MLYVQLNMISFICVLLSTLFVSTVAAGAYEGMRKDNVAQIKDNQIICDDVILDMGLSKNMNATKKDVAVHSQQFLCIVDPAYTLFGTRGIALQLMNVGEDFESEHAKARSVGRTQLVIKNSTLVGSSIHLPNERAETDFGNKVLDRMDFGGNSLSTILNWQHSLLNKGAGKTRALARNTVGIKSVLAIRISLNNTGAIKVPSKSARSVSDSIFGTDGDPVNLRSQYIACSYDRISFEAASGPELDNITSADGVIDVIIDYDDSDTSYKIENYVKAIVTIPVSDGGYGLDLDYYDHVIFHLPKGVKKGHGSGTDWIAHAQKPGSYSTFNDNHIMNVQILMHEIGHNLGLAHSGENNNAYGDTTCIMGFAVGYDGDLQKCFNGAKLFELEWFEDKTVSINPVRYEEFQGKLIGVSDYGDSTSDHTLVLEIKSSEPSSNPYYLTYNRAKTINSGTSEAINEVTIVQGRSERESTLIKKMRENSTEIFSDFHEGRDLIIRTGSATTDDIVGSIDYIPISVEIEQKRCLLQNDCNANLGPCSSGSCVDGLCIFETTPDCCGNGLCEHGESCTSCSDCKIPNDCNFVQGYNGDATATSPEAMGIKFDVSIIGEKAVAFYDLFMFPMSPSATNAKVYTKEGSHEGADDLALWDLVYDGEFSFATLFNIPIGKQETSAGSTRSFYITFATSYAFSWGSPGETDESNDAKIHLAQILPEQSGSVIPNAISVDAPNSFLGNLSYEYLEPGNKPPSTNTAGPSLRPSYQPSHVPSFDKPSSLPPIAAPTNGPNLTDENILSQHPSAIHRPTAGLQSLAPSSNTSISYNDEASSASSKGRIRILSLSLTIISILLFMFY